MTDKLADDFFARVDTDNSGRVSYSEYRAWALSEPTVLIFFSGLIEASKKLIGGGLVEKYTASVGGTAGELERTAIRASIRRAATGELSELLELHAPAAAANALAHVSEREEDHV